MSGRLSPFQFESAFEFEPRVGFRWKTEPPVRGSLRGRRLKHFVSMRPTSSRKRLQYDRVSAAEVGLTRRGVMASLSPVNSPHQLKLMEVQSLMDRSSVVSQLQTMQAMADTGMASSDGKQNGSHEMACGCPGCTGQQTQQPTTANLASAPIQRYCGMPGCTDPNCKDTKNHGYNRYRELRSTRIYNSDISKSNLGKGTGTNQKTRDYVQAPNAYYPGHVEIGYTSGNGSHRSGYDQPPLAPGEIPDAGHINGNQFGGSGRDTASIFAQHKKYNRGNSYNGERTFESWRKTENQIRSIAQKGGNVEVFVKLHNAALKALEEGSMTDQEYKDLLKQWGFGEDYDDPMDTAFDINKEDSYDSEDDAMNGSGGIGMTVV